MRAHEPVHVRGWNAELDLGFERRGDKTVLATRRHDGPLVVQKALHPEGPGICHAIVLHPPAGIAGGDDLRLTATAGGHAHALLTTPGATKWYRSAGIWARQRIAFDIAPGACIEWLPQETIVFDSAHAIMEADIALAAGATYLGWELLCLGRTGSGERFTSGELRLRTRITRAGVPVWVERGEIGGDSRLQASPAGLAGRTVCGTLLAAGDDVADAVLAACRAVIPESGGAAVTRLPGVLVARYLGDGSEAAKRYFISLWSILRPALAGRDAATPRIWHT
jgi:urease accessory protein